jgi:hypothetical protein
MTVGRILQMYGPELHDLAVENGVLEVGVELGIFGMLIYVSIMVIAAFKSFFLFMRTSNPLVKDISCGLAIVFLTTLLADSYSSYLKMTEGVFWFLLGIVPLLEAYSRENKHKPITKKTIEQRKATVYDAT